jgi:tetratricopeptide (TPR) repeat protein
MFKWFKKAVLPVEVNQIPHSAISLLNDGNTFLESGQLDKASACYRQALTYHPGYADALINLGFVLQQQGNLNDAAIQYQKAIEFVPEHLLAHQNLGFMLMNLGQSDAAEASFLRVIELNPDQPVVLHHLGIIAAQRGDFTQAEAWMRRTLTLQADYVDAHLNLGKLLLQTGRRADAEACFRQLLRLKPDHAETYCQLGKLLVETQRLTEAEASFRQALQIKPDAIDACHAYGNLLLELKRLPEAEAIYLLALQSGPDDATAHNNLGSILTAAMRYSEAETSFCHAIRLKPDYAIAYNNLGSLLMEAHRLSGIRAQNTPSQETRTLSAPGSRLPDAEGAFRTALRIDTEFASAYVNLGLLLVETNRPVEAEAAYRRALAINPDFIQAHTYLAHLLLLLGRYKEAWPHFEYRVPPPEDFYPNVAYPQWRGESLLGKTLLIWPEQGFGDYIQFARYASLLKSRGVSRLTLLCAQPLQALLETISGVDAVISDWNTIPPHDYWVFPLSLPLHFGTTLDTIPGAQSYLSACPSRMIKWQDRLSGDKLKVGLVWRGNPVHANDVNRSLPGLSTLAPLWSVPGVTFFSLQKGQDEAFMPPAAQPITALGNEIFDFTDTAAIVALLDLVICVDTSIAHIAGAMGRPCWVLLPAFGIDWRWLKAREDSPWYASLRLFRQSVPDDWAPTVERIRDALTRLAS